MASDPKKVAPQIMLSYRVKEAGATSLGGNNYVISVSEYLEALGFTTFIGELF